MLLGNGGTGSNCASLIIMLPAGAVAAVAFRDATPIAWPQRSGMPAFRKAIATRGSDFLAFISELNRGRHTSGL